MQDELGRKYWLARFHRYIRNQIADPLPGGLASSSDEGEGGVARGLIGGDGVQTRGELREYEERNRGGDTDIAHKAANGVESGGTG